VLVSLLIAALAADPSGWRHDGSGRFPAGAPVVWEEAAWEAPLPTWGNASPVVVGAQVCVTVEPVQLSCLSTADGAVQWTRAFPVVDTLGPDEATLAATLKGLGEASERVVALQQRASALARQARRGDVAAEAELSTVSDELAGLRATLSRHAAYLTPADREQIGYATSTPATDGRSLYPLFGNGVVAGVGLDGTMRWRRWLGALDEATLGYGVGHGASPLLVDGTLVVPWQRLRGLDPATGATRWEGPPFLRYGTPAVVSVDGVPHVVTPDGLVVRVRDGEVATRVDVEVNWSSPTAVPGGVLFVGGVGNPHGQVVSRATRVALSGSPPKARTTWQVEMPSGARVYASPVVVSDRIVTVTDDGELVVLSLTDGSVVHSEDLSCGSGYLPSIAASGSHAFVSCDLGKTFVVEVGDTVSVVQTNRTRAFRSTLSLQPGRVYVRTLDGVVAY
jgi:hypothetical protein